MPWDDFEQVQRKLEGLCLLMERKLRELDGLWMRIEDILFPLVQKGTASRAEIQKLWVSDKELARLGMASVACNNDVIPAYGALLWELNTKTIGDDWLRACVARLYRALTA